MPSKDSPYHKVLNYTGGELMVGGPAGTAKTHHCVLKAHKMACMYPGSVGVFVRKVKETIKRTITPTYYDVLGYNPMLSSGFVKGYGGTQPSEFHYRNGSLIFCIGLNDPKQLDSLQTDWFYVNQAEELEADDWEILTIRNRGIKMPYRIVYGDCNPSYPTHFLCPYQDNEERKTSIDYVPTLHIHNPLLAHPDGSWKPMGVEYVEGRLQNLTGTNYDRYYLGDWVFNEGAVYEIAPENIIDKMPDLSNCDLYRACDWGQTHPSVCLWIAEHRETKDVYVYREWRKTHSDILEMGNAIKKYSEGESIISTIIDHDENRQILLKRECKIKSKFAYKSPNSIMDGIFLIQRALRNAVEGKPGGLYIFDKLLIPGVDNNPLVAKNPKDLIREMQKLQFDPVKDKPIKEFDDASDALRYWFLYKATRKPKRDMVMTSFEFGQEAA